DLDLALAALELGAEADAAGLGAALLDDLVQAGEGAADDEQDVAGVDLQELLLRVLAATLRRHRGDCALDQLQQRLLHALARDVAGDGRVLGPARDLVDLVDVDDALLDRKSTRLNSSHVKSSYAVFSSKKKRCLSTDTNWS